MDKATNANTYEIYAKALEKVNKLKASGVEMSEHDLEILQKEIEIEEAKIGIEEAALAKTQVIRRKDSDGNWGYVYTAAAEEISNAVQNYEDKVFELEKLNDEYIDSMSDLILETEQEMSDAIRTIMEDTNLSAEEKERRIAEVTEFYSG
jgi:hypothetical protein